MIRCVALLRGINVGTAKRVPMADLRALVEDLGHRNVATLLNSGNVVFDAKGSNVKTIAAAIESRIQKTCGFASRVVVLTADQLDAVIAQDTLLTVAVDPRKHLVAFFTEPGALSTLKPLLAQSWKPDVIAVGALAAYLWCSSGILDSKLPQAFSRLMGESVTTRNWATTLKLQAAARASRKA